MLAISTAYWPNLEDGQKILDEIDRLGFHSIELSSYTDRKPLDQMLPSLRRKRVNVVSLHNPCPKYVPRPLPWETDRPEPLVTSGDPEERETAIQLACKTFELAAELEASAVVLHLGVTGMPSPTDALKEMFDRDITQSDEGRERIQAFLEERVRAGETIWDALSFSLEALTRRAERLSLRLGVENRICLHEVPTYDEIERILGEFAGGSFGFWFDVGHATVHQNLGLIRMEEMLAKLGDHVIGLHLHDAKGHADHIAPGAGDTHYAVAAPYVREDTLRILEVHPQASEEELPDAVAVLTEAGLLPHG